MVSKGQDVSNGLGIYPVEALLATTKAAFIAGASSSSAFIDFFMDFMAYKHPSAPKKHFTWLQQAFMAFIAFIAFMAFIAFIA